MRFLPVVLLAACMCGLPATRAPAQVRPGDIAPDFTYRDASGTAYTLSDYRGNVVLLGFIGSG